MEGKVFVVLSFTTLAGSNLGHENDCNRRPLGRLIFDRHDYIYESGVVLWSMFLKQKVSATQSVQAYL
jgi:hypothetical protein